MPDARREKFRTRALGERRRGSAARAEGRTRRPVTFAGELFGERGTDEGLHGDLVPDAELLEGPHDPPRDACGELYQLVVGVVPKFHAFYDMPPRRVAVKPGQRGGADTRRKRVMPSARASATIAR